MIRDFWRKIFFGSFFVILGGHRSMSPKILVKIGPFEAEKLPGILYLEEESEKKWSQDDRVVFTDIES
jgi:hypothetical protein